MSEEVTVSVGTRREGRDSKMIRGRGRDEGRKRRRRTASSSCVSGGQRRLRMLECWKTGVVERVEK